jgi:3-oxoacyl-[acyl-carrier protein] reductase
MDLKNKNIIVSGGANGIGKDLALILLKQEANVIIFDIDTRGMEALKSEFPQINVISCDVSSTQDVEKGINEVVSKYKKIDVLVNNAGYIYNSPLISLGKTGLVKHDYGQWQKVINTDLSSVFYMTLNVVEKMIMTRTRGLVINVSSISANGNPGQSAYSAAKAGIEALTSLWAKELGGFRIRVAGIAPGFASTDTTMDSMSEAMIAKWQKETPSRRFAKAAEIAEGIIFIMRNDYFNGKILQLDGGLKI